MERLESKAGSFFSNIAVQVSALMSFYLGVGIIERPDISLISELGAHTPEYRRIERRVSYFSQVYSGQ